LATLTGLCSLSIETPEITTYFNNNPTIHHEGLRALRSLTLLHTLALDHAHVDDEDVQALASLTALQSLAITRSEELSDVGVASLSASFSNLTNLNLSCCRTISGEGFGTLTSLSKLTQLRLHQTQLRTSGFLASLTSLQLLSICHCEALTELSGLVPLTNLQELHLRDCGGLDGNLQALRGLVMLHTLSLSSESPITEEGMHTVIALPKLHTFVLGSRHKLLAEFRLQAPHLVIKQGF
jgi:hypothetical protein